jgi:general secretion pathway protein I
MTLGPPHPRHNGGFSLVEIVVAILILGVALAGLTEGITTALQASKDSEVQTGAVLMAAGLVETLRAEGDLTDGDTDGEGTGGLSRFRWKESVEATRTEGLHQVTVTVLDKNSAQAVFELKTLLFETPEGTGPAQRADQPDLGSNRRGSSERRRHSSP